MSSAEARLALSACISLAGRAGTTPGSCRNLDDPAMVTFALVALSGAAAGKAAGIASYMRIEPAHGQVEVAGILLGRSLQRTTAATEAMHLLMAHAFDELGYRRYEWKCDSLNEPSRRAALRLGFVEEGRFRNHMVTQGRSRDTDWFSVTDAEWPAVRAAHQGPMGTDDQLADRNRRVRGDGRRTGHGSCSGTPAGSANPESAASPGTSRNAACRSCRPRRRVFHPENCWCKAACQARW